MSLSVKKSLATTLVGIFILAFAAAFWAQDQKANVITGPQDLPPGPMQGKATTSCLECHEARIILQQRLSKAAWTKEVDKMVKWGALVEASDHDALVDYLSTNFSPDQPAYEPPRTSPEKSGSAKKSK
jgi:hypothetical protein